MKINSMKDLSSHIAKLEGKTHQATIGDIREILSIISDLLSNSNVGQKVLILLLQNGLNRKK